MELEIKIDELNKEVYSFWHNDTVLVLNSYRLMNRENTRKRNYTTLKIYERIGRRDNNITELEVPFGEDIRKKALDLLISRLSVKTWSEYKTW